MAFGRWILFFPVVFGCAVAFGQMTDKEKKGIEDSLYVGNLRLGDLRFERKPFQDPYRLKFIDECLDDPLESADKLMAWHAAGSSGEASGLLESAIRNGFSDLPRSAPVVGALPIAGPTAVPPGLMAIVIPLVAALQACDAEIRGAVSKLTPQEQRELIEGLPVWAVEEPKVKFDFVRGATPPQKRLLELLGKTDTVRIRSAAVWLTKEAEKARDKVKAGRFEFVGINRVVVGGLPIEIAGQGDDVHDSTDARLTIDLGGNDTYSGRHGAGVGYSGVLFDLGGSDRYEEKDLSVGAGVLGVGIAFDEGGHDVFRGKSVCYGCGLAGVGVFEKKYGDDLYQAVSLAQGYGQFGVGLCLDSDGDDRYNIKLFGQGAARTQGVGWLVDRHGSDQYRAGGLSMNEPLFTGVAYSFAQGLGSGYREDTGGVSGGIGLLTDLQGDDFYLGETYMQAASYWFAVGSLYDAEGNDTYTGYHYCQASAMHCCGAFLFDLAGDDGYLTKVGASLAIGHDYGVALFLDRAGSDLYSARDSTPGVGVANGLGVFVDSEGTDRYDGPPGQGNAARGTGSLGVFVDLGGQDKYRAGLADGLASTTSLWGTAYDAESAPLTAQPSVPVHQTPKPGTAAKPSDAEMEAVYSKAVLWGVGSAQKDVEENLDRLIAIGTPAFEWMIEKHLATMDRLQQRAFVAVAKALGTEAGKSIGDKALHGTNAEKKNLIAVCMDAGIIDIAAILPALLSDPELQLVAAKAAGPLKAAACVDGLSVLCLNKDRLVARSAMISLMQIGEPSTVGTAQAMLNSLDMPTRRAALSLISSFPVQAKPIADQLLADVDEVKARMGIQILSKSGSDEALNAIGPLLLDPRPGVRIEAMEALNGRCPSAYVAAMIDLKKDPVDIVRAVARTVNPTK